MSLEAKYCCKKILLPEIYKNIIVNNQTELVFDSDFRYDVILGSEFLQKAGMILNAQLEE